MEIAKLEITPPSLPAPQTGLARQRSDWARVSLGYRGSRITQVCSMQL